MENNLVRKKRNHTKVKTGCITCRPSCRRCTSTGRHCDGYPLSSWVAGKMPPSLSTISGSHLESQAIYHFRTRVTSLLASAFDRKFWTHDLLHKADAFVPIRHALAGLASAYQKSILLDIRSPTCDRFIFWQYEKAMISLYTCFQDGKTLSEYQQSAALVANLLFTILCSLQGLRQEALIHLRNGLALIHEWHINLGTPRDDPQTILMKDILALYIRFDNQSRVICQGIATTQSWKDRLLSRLAESAQTPTVCQALAELENIHNQILQLPDYQACANLAVFYQKALSSWDVRFQRLATTSPHLSHITSLEMRREVVELTFSMKLGRQDHRISVDEHCRAILDLAHRLIQQLSLRANQASFHLACGLVEALYFVAVTGRDWDLRQQSIDTLRRYRFVDGIWGSIAAADLASSRLQSDMDIYRLQLETTA
ncbi:hypothetical protein FGRMN_3061 [Fusarium graminum]|nr:hypothetical protein FGRMN_3061 [Fusarium graminum]